jgi:hypothetical protein
MPRWVRGIHLNFLILPDSRQEHKQRPPINANLHRTHHFVHRHPYASPLTVHLNDRDIWGQLQLRLGTPVLHRFDACCGMRAGSLREPMEDKQLCKGLYRG